MIGICSTKKKYKITNIVGKKCCLCAKKTKTKQLKKVVSEDQVNFKSDTSDQAIEKAFHIILNLIISTALSYNADFIVIDDQVKNALIKVYRNEKEYKRLSSNL